MVGCRTGDGPTIEHRVSVVPSGCEKHRGILGTIGGFIVTFCCVVLLIFLFL